MSAKFYCTNKECKKDFYFEVSEEVLIDENNMAVLYCPFCTDKLMRSILPPSYSTSELADYDVQNNNND